MLLEFGVAKKKVSSESFPQHRLLLLQVRMMQLNQDLGESKNSATILRPFNRQLKNQQVPGPEVTLRSPNVAVFWILLDNL
jgi:hypothetical protein